MKMKGWARLVFLGGVTFSLGAGAVPTVMAGNGLKVTLDLDAAFYKNNRASVGYVGRGQEVIGHFERLASPRTRGLQLKLYVLVHKPTEKKLPEIRDWVLRQVRGRGESPEVANFKSPPGFAISFWEGRGTFSYSTWNLYFQTLQHSQAVELRFYASVRNLSVDDVSGIEEIAGEVIRSIRVEKLPTRNAQR